jgi:formate hydrogenlyase subunit 6/NADH:ubiquinone oxidoreductase subunit I
MKTVTRYWKALRNTWKSLRKGLAITLSHLVAARKSRKAVAIFQPAYFVQPDGISTIVYPHVTLPVPETGRYKLHNEIDDCIVCDKCAKVCPVNCITIEPIKAVEEFGKTSDGTPKRIYAAKFDIDMGKCCFCGLCTTVCPTECLTMTPEYDFSVTDIREHTFPFAVMTQAEINQRKRELEAFNLSKTKTDSAPAAPAIKPMVKPRIKPTGT